MIYKNLKKYMTDHILYMIQRHFETQGREKEREFDSPPQFCSLHESFTYAAISNSRR